MSAADPQPNPDRQLRTTFVAITTLFFAWGFVTSMNDPLIPAVRAIFELSYAQSLLTQFAFFIAYGLFSVPAGRLLGNIGYGRAIAFALLAMTVGCLCIPLATEIESYTVVLVSLFIIASGMTLLQVAANPLVAALGGVASSHFRLTLSQAFNSLGTVIGPWFGASLMLSGGMFAGHPDSAVGRDESLNNIDHAYYLMAVLLGLLMICVWWMRERLDTTRPATGKHATVFAALKSKWALFGAATIFAYVGAEVAIASLMINFLHQSDVLDVPLERAGALLGLFYWGGAMAGRFGGSLLLTRVRPARLLSFAAVCAALLCLTVLQSRGPVAATAALAVGLFNSIMFPVIFTVTLERSSASRESTSGLLCMAILGGALLPPLAGRIADAAGLHNAFIVPMLAYGLIAAFAFKAAHAHLSYGMQPVATAAVDDVRRH